MGLSSNWQNLAATIKSLKHKPDIYTDAQLKKIIQTIDTKLPLDYKKITDFDGFEDIRKAKVAGVELPQTQIQSEQLQEFWDTINLVISQIDFATSNYQDTYCKTLIDYLQTNRNKNQIEKFETVFLTLAHSPQIEKTLDQTEYSLYFSDDGLVDFGAFLVSQGQEFYNFCLISPNNMKAKLDQISEERKYIDKLYFEGLGDVLNELGN